MEVGNLRTMAKNRVDWKAMIEEATVRIRPKNHRKKMEVFNHCYIGKTVTKHEKSERKLRVEEKQVTGSNEELFHAHAVIEMRVG